MARQLEGVPTVAALSPLEFSAAYQQSCLPIAADLRASVGICFGVWLQDGNQRNLYVPGGFLKWGYLQFIHFNGSFPYKPSILEYPHLWKPPPGFSGFNGAASWMLLFSVKSTLPQKISRCREATGDTVHGYGSKFVYIIGWL